MSNILGFTDRVKSTCLFLGGVVEDERDVVGVPALDLRDERLPLDLALHLDGGAVRLREALEADEARGHGLRRQRQELGRQRADVLHGRGHLN